MIRPSDQYIGIDYDHAKNRHSLDGPRAVLPILFRQQLPESLLDVGCGTGTWLKAAAEAGISDLLGVDGCEIAPDRLLFDVDKLRTHDLSRPLDLGRRFEMVLCLEVAEHLEEAYASVLIATLVRHADLVVFSAATPGQEGQNHVNCQWPEYWQRLFNLQGFACEDRIRWCLWALDSVEPWYRQNIFVARLDPARAGTERRIPGVIHPDLLRDYQASAMRRARAEHISQMEGGHMPVKWYFTTALRGPIAKLKRRAQKGREC